MKEADKAVDDGIKDGDGEGASNSRTNLITLSIPRECGLLPSFGSFFFTIYIAR